MMRRMACDHVPLEGAVVLHWSTGKDLDGAPPARLVGVGVCRLCGDVFAGWWGPAPDPDPVQGVWEYERPYVGEL